MKNYIGIDLGGTKISGILADEQGVEKSKKIVSTNAAEGEHAVMERILGLIDSLLDDAKLSVKDVSGIGIGSPGAMDVEKGILIQTANLPFTDFALIAPIEEKFGIPTHLDNDANVAALAEYTFGAGRGSRNMVFVTVSTGIGAGAVVDGKFYRGSTGSALELGHISVEKDGELCKCGNRGCTELYASGTAIARAAQRAVDAGAETSLSGCGQITAYEVFQAAAAGDETASAVIDEALSYLGVCVANAAALFDPDVIVIGGGVAQAGDVVFDRVRQIVGDRCLKPVASHARILPAALGSDAGVVGAVALAIMEGKEEK